MLYFSTRFKGQGVEFKKNFVDYLKIKILIIIFHMILIGSKLLIKTLCINFFLNVTFSSNIIPLEF